MDAPPTRRARRGVRSRCVEPLGGRVAGVRIDAAGHVTVLPPPKGVVSVVTGGPFGLAMARPSRTATGASPPSPRVAPGSRRSTGAPRWAPIEAPPVGTLEATVDARDSFACSPIGCALPSGVVRLGWGSKPPEPAAELALTAAASPRIREPSPLALTCRIDADALPSSAPRRPARAPFLEPAAPIALRLPVERDFGTLRDRTWTGDVLPPFQPASSLRRITATFPEAGPARGSRIPILAAGPHALVDLMLFRERTGGGLERRLRAGGGAASFLPFDVHSHPDIAADGPDGSLVLLDASGGDVWVSRGAATSAALHLLRVPDVSRTRLTLARRIEGGALALAGYSTTTGEIFAGALDLGRAEVGPLAAIGQLSDLAETGACPRATYRLLVELPVRLRISGRNGEVLFEDQVTALALILAGGDERVCVEAVEAALHRRQGVLRAVLGAGGIASVWSEGATARGTCSAAKRP